MRSTQNVTISVGLMNIPVGIGTAISEKGAVSFKTIHKECKQPVSVKTVANEAKGLTAPGSTVVWCGTCEKEVSDTLKGYEFAKGQFVSFTQEEIDEAKGGRSKVVHLNKFVKAADLSPKQIENQHFLIPNDAPQVAATYGVLYQVLAETKSVGIGRMSIWGVERPIAIAPDQSYASGGVLMMLTLHCADDIVEPDFSAPIPDATTKKLAKQMLTLMSGTLEPSDLTSSTRSRVSEMIGARIEGLDLPSYDEEREGAATVDIQETLKKQIAELQKKKPAPRKRATRKAA